MKFSLCLLAAATLLTPAVANAAPNLVTNGDFTMATSANASYKNFELSAAGGTNYGTVTGWNTVVTASTSNNPYNLLFTTGAGPNAAETTTTPGSPTAAAANAWGQYTASGQEYLASGFNQTSPTGGNFMALDGDSAVSGALQQSVGGLTAGALYELDFYWGAAQIASRQGATTEQLQVSFGANTVSTAVVNNASSGFTGWVKQTYFFTAATAVQTLSFLSIGTPSGYPPVALLDGVSITAAPEPSALALLASGIGALAFFGRRRRAPKTIAA